MTAGLLLYSKSAFSSRFFYSTNCNYKDDVNLCESGFSLSTFLNKTLLKDVYLGGVLFHMQKKGRTRLAWRVRYFEFETKPFF